MKIFTKKITALALTACLFFIIPTAHSQYQDNLEDITGHWEASLMAGATNFFGDLGGNKGKGTHFIKDFNGPATRPLFGVSLNYFKYSWLSLKASLNYTTATGADSLIKNTGDAERWRYYRNLSFRSRIIEGSISAEIYPVMLFDHEVEVHTISPYIGAGIGLFHFNPKAYYKGQWVDLRPLHTEGEGFAEYPDRKMYHRLQIYFPVTAGVKIYINNTFAVSAGLILRKTFTDYIDDVHTTYIDPVLFDKYLSSTQTVSTLGTQAAVAKALYSRSITPWKVKPDILKANPKDNDSYATFFLTLSVRFGGGPRFFYGG